jgi:hypothetical protein
VKAATFTLDHLLCIRDRRHRRLVVAAFRKLAQRRGGVFGVDVLHEDDLSCCRLEAWAATARRIAEALEADGSPAVWALVGARGVEEVAG